MRSSSSADRVLARASLRCARDGERLQRSGGQRARSVATDGDRRRGIELDPPTYDRCVRAVENQQEHTKIAVSLPAGTYDVVVTLETALDRPSRTVRAHVPEDGRFHATASFATSILEVRFTTGGRAAAGLAVIRRDGREIGTLGSGISARVSAGRYEVMARYRTSARTYTVDLAPEQRRAIRATF